MKKIFILFFILLISCSTGNKVYICGDRPCKDKKEIDDYFKNNISMEVYVIEKDKIKKENQDLVKLNLSNYKNVKKKKDEFEFLSKRKENNSKMIEKKKGKKEKLKVKKPIKEKKPNANITQQKSKVESLIENKTLKKTQTNKNRKKFVYNKPRSTKIVHLCKSLDECDIDIISKKVTDLSENKSFPDINFK